ncbi:protein TPX2-like isoform X1 [Senna tora]|uniref:Protein TPX2-like isoform X1 n=1 Tax=Senna tora TaxID=362788 RepID=A0A834TU74_9FABA|nr:protein TPX2-like isoform X1 [Senna tora]
MQEMEEDMEIEHEHVFVAHEIDLDYEFDAARFFDFTRQETPAEARQAERWFETAGSYPPSPFVSKLVMREDIILDNVNASPNSKQLEDTMDCSKMRVPLAMEYSETDIDYKVGVKEGGKISGLLGGILRSVAKQPVQATTGLTFYSKTTNDNLNLKAKSAVPRSSTLMKPTASQLAKQNRPLQNVGSRFQKLLAPNNERKLSISSGVENQAAKRQKLDGGLLRKVADLKQQTNFFHKAPKNVVISEQNFATARLKLTIPVEPDLETAQRAQRIRPKNAAETKQVAVAAHRFKARPLNRKILDAPSLPLPKRSTPRLPEFQEFHLKTLERATQHTSASSSSSVHCNDSDKGLDKSNAISAPENRIRDLRRPSTTGVQKHGGLEFTHNFKARPLNKKIFSSKGDIGVFRNKKQETTVPVDFNFQTEKRVQHNPPVELFSKLSLTSELQPNNGSQLKLPQHSGMFRKESKENILSSFHPVRKEKPSMFGGKQIQCGSDDCGSEAGYIFSARR